MNRRNAWIWVVAVMWAATIVAPAGAQLGDTFWPKFQGDAQNTGLVSGAPSIGSPRLRWSLDLAGDAGWENQSTVTFAEDGTLYVGTHEGKLYAINPDGTEKWNVTLAPPAALSPGQVLATPTVGADGTIYVGVWGDLGAIPPRDGGFYAVTDNGASGTIKWAYPDPTQTLSSAAIAPTGEIIFGANLPLVGWSIVALKEVPAAPGYVVAWTIDADPASIEAGVSGSPALSADGRYAYVGSSENHLFRAIDVAAGTEVTFDCLFGNYFWASTPAVAVPPPEAIATPETIYICSGMDWTTPDPTKEGKVWAFNYDPSTDAITEKWSLAMNNGHLNGGVGPIRTITVGEDEVVRLYAMQTANGGTCRITALDDTAGGPVTVWSQDLGPSAWGYSNAVVLEDGTIYVVGTANGTLYALRDQGATVSVAWTVALTDLNPAAPVGMTNAKGLTVGPTGIVYWNAVDGNLYAIGQRGDVDGNGVVNGLDLTAVITAWMTVPGDPLWNPLADLDGSTVVDGLDLTEVISNWTPPTAAAPAESESAAKPGKRLGNIRKGSGDVRSK